jgi:hypothetical protein
MNSQPWYRGPIPGTNHVVELELFSEIELMRSGSSWIGRASRAEQSKAGSKLLQLMRADCKDHGSEQIKATRPVPISGWTRRQARQQVQVLGPTWENIQKTVSVF